MKVGDARTDPALFAGDWSRALPCGEATCRAGPGPGAGAGPPRRARRPDLTVRAQGEGTLALAVNGRRVAVFPVEARPADSGARSTSGLWRRELNDVSLTRRRGRRGPRGAPLFERALGPASGDRSSEPRRIRSGCTPPRSGSGGTRACGPSASACSTRPRRSARPAKPPLPGRRLRHRAATSSTWPSAAGRWGSTCRRRRCASAAVAGVNVVRGSVLDLPFTARASTASCSFDVLYHAWVTDDRRGGARRRPGPALGGPVPRPGARAPAALGRPRRGGALPASIHTGTELRALLERAGLEVLRSELLQSLPLPACSWSGARWTACWTATGPTSSSCPRPSSGPSAAYFSSRPHSCAGGSTCPSERASWPWPASRDASGRNGPGIQSARDPTRTRTRAHRRGARPGGRRAAPGAGVGARAGPARTGPSVVLPEPRPVRPPEAVPTEPPPAPESLPTRPDAAAVNALWRSRCPAAPGACAVARAAPLDGLLGGRFEAQRRFNAQQVQLDNALLGLPGRPPRRHPPPLRRACSEVWDAISARWTSAT